MTDVRDDAKARLMPEELADAVRLVMASLSAITVDDPFRTLLPGDGVAVSHAC